MQPLASNLSDIVERSSDERARSSDRQSSEPRRSYEQRRSGERTRNSNEYQRRTSGVLPSESSNSEHYYELQEIKVDTQSDDKAESPFSRAAAYDNYRAQLEPPRSRPRGPASSSAEARHELLEPSASIPRDSKELRRSSKQSFETSMQSMQSIPEGADPASFVLQATLDKAAKDNARRPSFQAVQLGTRNSSIPQRVRISIDDANAEPRSALNATLVKRRRRLPWKLLLVFGIASCLSLVVALCTLSIGAYNMNKLRAARAAKTIDALSAELMPKIMEIMRLLNARN